MAAKPHAGKKVAGSIRPWVVKTINMLHPSHPSEKALPSADAPVWPSRSSLAALEGYLSGEKKNEVPAYLQYTSDIFLWIPSTNSKFIYIFFIKQKFELLFFMYSHTFRIVWYIKSFC